MENKIVLKYNDTLLFLLLGSFCFGGAKGRFLLGLSVFDLLLIVFFIRSVLTRKIANPVFFLFGILGFGTIVAALNAIFTDISYSYFVTEFRFYLYLPLIYQIIASSLFDKEKLQEYLRVLMIIYFIIFIFFLEPGGFVFNIFNEERSARAFDFIGRISGPQVIFLSIVYFITLASSKKINIINTVLYGVLVILIYVKTGERTVLLTNILPLVWLVYEKRSVWMLSVIPILGSVVPLYLNKTQIKRFNAILNPLDDPAFVYRLMNIKVMICEKMFENFHSFISGFGIGSEYKVFVMWYPVESYFLDNSFVMFTYKLGLPVTLIFLIFLYSRILSLKLSSKLYLAIFITIPALTSYHLILQPAYLMSYFFAIKILKDSDYNENYSSLSKT